MPAHFMCPTCAESGLQATYFCEQACFKNNWKTHKAVHSAPPPPPSIPSMDPRARATFKWTGKLQPGLLSARRVVPTRIQKPEYAVTAIPAMEDIETMSPKWERYTPEELTGIARTCALAREVLDIGLAAVRPGITTDDLDRIVHVASIARNGYPSPLNYRSFPKSVCTSINEVICHGIPDSTVLREGDIINLDVTLYEGGFHGDMNETCFVGRPSDDAVRLVVTAWEALANALKTAKPGALFRQFGRVISDTVEAKGFAVNRTYCGHGIGRLFHCKPNVPHYYPNRSGDTMEEGMVFTVEPMINQGHHGDVLWPDNWTAVTVDGKLSSQFEHQILITPTGPRTRASSMSRTHPVTTYLSSLSPPCTPKAPPFHAHPPTITKPPTTPGCDVLSARKADPHWLPYFYSQLDALGINENVVLGRDPNHPRAQVPGAPAIPKKE